MPKRKGVIWTEEDVDLQRQLNKRAMGQAFNPIGEAGLFMPVHVVTSEQIEEGDRGTCEFLSGQIGAPLRSGRTAEMWNRVNEGTIEKGEECLAVRITQPDSAGGGWSLIRSSGKRGGFTDTSTCSNYSSDTFQPTNAVDVFIRANLGTFASLNFDRVPTQFFDATHKLVHDGSIELPTALGSWNACKYVKSFQVTFFDSSSNPLLPRNVPGGKWWIMLEFKFSSPNYFQDLTIHSEKWNSTAVLRTDNAGSAPDMGISGSAIEFTSVQTSPRPPHFAYGQSMARGLIIISPPLKS